MSIKHFRKAFARAQMPCALLLGSCLMQASMSGYLLAASQPLTLKEATALAIDRAPLLKAGDAQIEAALHDVARADKLPDPMLTFGVESVPIAGADAFSLSDDPMTMRSVGLSQAFPSRAKRDARRDTALALQAQADIDRSVSALEIKRATASAWIALWSAQSEHGLLTALRTQAELVVATAEARVRGGTGSASDALSAHAGQLELDNRIEDALSAIDQAQVSLARWIQENSLRELADEPNFSQLPLPADELLARVDQHAALQVWDGRETVALAAVAESRAERRPDWSIAAGVSKRNAGASNVIWFEVGIGLPVFPAQRQQRGIRARQADLQALHAAREDARLEQLESVRKLLAQWGAQTRKIERFKASILPLARDRSAATLAAWSGGADLQAWIDARNDDIRLRIEYARLLGEWGQSWAGLAFLLVEEGTP